MQRVERLIVGHTLASYCVDGLTLDPIGLPPYPLRRFGEVPVIPMLVEECPEKASCVEISNVEVVKEGNGLKKACGPIKKCQEPWPIRWLNMDRRLLIVDIDVKPRNKILVGSIKQLDLARRNVTLRGGRTIAYEELVWTAPYPYLARLLNIKEPKSAEATIAIAKVESEWELMFHFGRANPFIAAVKDPRSGIAWFVATGYVDAGAALNHLKKKGHVDNFELLVSLNIRHFVLEAMEVEVPKGVRLLGRTGAWKETSVGELLKCAF